MSLAKASDITAKGCNTGYYAAEEILQSQDRGEGIGLIVGCWDEGRNAWTVSLDWGGQTKSLQHTCEQTGGIVRKFYLGGDDGWVLECHYKN